MSDLKKTFEESLNFVKTTEGSPSNELKLEMYALFKQATEGDVSGKRPGMLDMINRAKFDAWNKIKGTDSEAAMQMYIDKVEEFKSTL